MTDKPNSITLDPQGDDFLLTRVDGQGVVTSIVLADGDVLTLVQSAQRLKDHILAKHSPKVVSGVDTGLVVPVAQCRLNTDMHQTEILLTMIDPHGAETNFLLSLPVAKGLSERLPRRILQIETAATKTTKQ